MVLLEASNVHKSYGSLKVLKGIDLIVNMAEKFPDYSFTLIGGEDKRALPKNVRTLGFIDRTEIIMELSAHQFYFQLSISGRCPRSKHLTGLQKNS